MDEIEKICLSHNGISDEGTHRILESINLSAQELNISYNNFTAISLLNLALQLNKTSICNLKILNLEGNRLGDSAIKIFFDNCNAKIIKLKNLNLSRNRLTSTICSNIKMYITNNNYLLELYLHWNLIEGEGGKFII